MQAASINGKWKAVAFLLAMIKVKGWANVVRKAYCQGEQGWIEIVEIVFYDEG